MQTTLFESDSDITLDGPRLYKGVLTVSVNNKGVQDVDTIKGCTEGMRARPDVGCYGECYAAKIAKRYGIDFSISVTRKLMIRNDNSIFNSIKDFEANWYRIGTAGDPSHDWEHTIHICEALRGTKKVPVIITKHWKALSDQQIERLRSVKAVINTSTSAFDTDEEFDYRVGQIKRLRDLGIHSVNRIVTCNFGRTAWGKIAREKQRYLMTIKPFIDNPLRVSANNHHVKSGDIIAEHNESAIGGGKFISLHSKNVFLGKCLECPDQCGVEPGTSKETNNNNNVNLFNDTIEWVHVESVIGSGYEDDVARLAIADVIAKRAARKNMQIHSAIILKINENFSGFFTFQVNHVSKEFCLLQSVIEPEVFSHELYEEMARRVIGMNTYGYPSIITTDPKSKFETPELFEKLGFKTYLKMSGFCYMVRGDIESVRMKYLAHITMTNVWNSTKGDWLRSKDEWRSRIDASGERMGIPNPAFATREGCWQGEQGMANVVTKDPTKKGKENGRAHNGNASVLDPVVCEVIARFFMPQEGKRIYNPFAGGVQFGFVAGSCGYEYIGSEIRRNQCDANNSICSEFENVKWIQSDSTVYEPEGMFDLIFTCPPYYRVERYVDYDGNPPDGEINTFDTYEAFRDALFAGYTRAISHLNENCFFVVMTGDSRDKKGAYHCSEAETELFLKNQGLHVYNKIIYLEAEFTRLAHAKKTLHLRKFPKREQKIIVAFKGRLDSIKTVFTPIGRL